jgi:signal transduction histidine kinase
MKPSDYFKIGPRLTLAFALLIALILAGNALVIWQLHMARIQTDRLIGANQQLIAVLQFQVGILSFHQRLDDLARSGDAHYLTSEAEPLRRVLHEQAQQTRTALGKLPPGTRVDPAFLPTLETIEVSLPAQLDAINDLAKSADWGTLQRRLDNELKPIETQTSVLVGSIQQQANGELTQAVLKMASVQRRILFIVPATAISTFFIAAFFGWAITRRIVELRLQERVSERTRLARDLHDTLLQTLQGSKLVADDAREHRSDAEYTSRSLDKLSGWIDRATREGRAALNTLHGSAFDNRELSKRLQSALDECEPYGVSERILNISGTPLEVDPIVTDEICSVGREAIRNAFMHSRATRIEVQLNYSEDFTMIVRDNGRGMDSTTASKGRDGHFGLQSMRERAARIHAQFQLITAPNLGTTVELKIVGKTAFGGKTSVWSKLRSWLEGTRRSQL